MLNKDSVREKPYLSNEYRSLADHIDKTGKPGQRTGRESGGNRPRPKPNSGNNRGSK